MRIGILGAGTMGKGIALLCATKQYEVVLYTRQSTENVHKNLQRMERIERRLFSVPRGDQAAVDKITIVNDLSAIGSCELILEAVAEDLPTKIEAVRQIERVVGPSTVIASNTSSLKIADLAASAARPNRIIGLHFFNPPTSLKLVEVTRTSQTDEATTQTALDFVKSVSKTPIAVPDSPGFVVNRLLFLMINEAVRFQFDTAMPYESIDTCMKAGTNMPMGPFELADAIGLDVCVNILKNLHRETGNATYAPAPALLAKIGEGKTGRKAGGGFYSYRSP